MKHSLQKKLSSFLYSHSSELDLDNSDYSLLSAIRPGRLDASSSLKIYKNNLFHSLKGALEDSFPLSREILGGECFANLVKAYILVYPCRSSFLQLYGEHMPRFTAREIGLKEMPYKEIPYIEDFMRLEMSYQEVYYSLRDDLQEEYENVYSYFQKLVALSPEETRLFLSRSVRLIDSPYPLLDIWHYTLLQKQKNPKQCSKTASSTTQKLQLKNESHSLILYQEEEKVSIERISSEDNLLLKAISGKDGISLAQISTGVMKKNTQEEIVQKLYTLFNRGWLGNGKKVC